MQKPVQSVYPKKLKKRWEGVPKGISPYVL